jgi:LPXTG-motif cell wall-anchored protein
MGNNVTICHFNQGGYWDAVTVSTNALNGHDNHELDIWPPIEDTTEGSNWPGGEAVYLNGCVLAATPEPTPTPTDTATGTASPSPTLPETGAGENVILSMAGIFLIGAGIWLKLKALRS